MLPCLCPAEPRAPDPGGGGHKTAATRRQKKKKPTRKQTPAASATEWRKPADLNAAELEACLRHYLLTPRQLQSLGFPVESDLHPGRAVIFHPFPPYELVQEPRCSDSWSGSSGSDDAEDDGSLTDTSVRSEERRCVRCGRGFFLLQGKYLTTERCVYHWGKPQRYHGYSCCQGVDGAVGCVSAKLHVWTGVELGVNGPLDGYVVTQPRKKPPDGYGVYAIDCEMCFTTQGLELCKVSVVGLDGKIVYNSYVKPNNPVVDYNTRFSGITSKHLQKNSSVKTIKEVQKDILEFVSSGTILIGHGLENDLKALKIIHGTVVDTAVAFPHHYGLPYRRSLRSLVTTVLQRDIQTSSHDSVEDALACIHLMLFRLACDFPCPPTQSF